MNIMRDSLIVLIQLLLLIIDISEATTFSHGGLKCTRHKRQENGCVLPPHPEHGQWKLLSGKGRPGENVTEGSVIKYECESGYKIFRSKFVVCDGTWNPPQLPECEGLCPPLVSSSIYQLRCIDRRGNEVKCSEATYGTYLEYNCTFSYETPFGYKKTLFCDEGKWDQKPICQPVCGNKIPNDAKPLVYGGRINQRLESPWVAALYSGSNGTWEQICGSTILSLTVVLTAAHCVTNEYGNALPENIFLVGAGKLHRKYQAPEDTHAQYLEVSKVIAHDYFKAGSNRFLADIALLVMKGEFILNEVIQPVCFQNLKSIYLIPGNLGEVSGWGTIEGEITSDVLRTLEVPYKHETICVEELPSDWANKYNLIDKFCAGFLNKSRSVCQGDSGGGLVFKNFEDQRYYIHGIVSLSPRSKLTYSCNSQQNALYTRLSSYYDYLDRLLSKYAPEIKDCILPDHPKNGNWTIDKQEKKPGDIVSSNTILRVRCNEGSIPSSSEKYIRCDSASKMPTCQQLCPALNFSIEVQHHCKNKDGQVTNCLGAAEGSTLTYTCPEGYIVPRLTNNTRFCVGGSWGTPQPGCVRPIEDCGRLASSSDFVTVNGTSKNRQVAPWNVLVYAASKEDPGQVRYLDCTGSLISDNLVLTTIQCLTVKDEFGKTVQNLSYFMGVGKKYTHYNDSRDEYAQYSEVYYIVVHHRYKEVITVTAGNTVILVPKSRFNFSDFVQPICFYGVNNIQLQPGDLGLVPRLNDNDIFESVETPYKDLNVCFNELPEIARQRLNLKDKICVVEPTNWSRIAFIGDAGSGFAVKNPEDNRYYIHGVFNLAYQLNCKGCHENRKGLYTSIPFYYLLIENTLNNVYANASVPAFIRNNNMF